MHKLRLIVEPDEPFALHPRDDAEPAYFSISSADYRRPPSPEVTRARIVEAWAAIQGRKAVAR